MTSELPSTLELVAQVLEEADEAARKTLDLFEVCVSRDDAIHLQFAAIVLAIVNGRLAGRHGYPAMTSREAWARWTDSSMEPLFRRGFDAERATDRRPERATAATDRRPERADGATNRRPERASAPTDPRSDGAKGG